MLTEYDIQVLQKSFDKQRMYEQAGMTKEQAVDRIISELTPEEMQVHQRRLEEAQRLLEKGRSKERGQEIDRIMSELTPEQRQVYERRVKEARLEEEEFRKRHPDC